MTNMMNLEKIEEMLNILLDKKIIKIEVANAALTMMYYKRHSRPCVQKQELLRQLAWIKAKTKYAKAKAALLPLIGACDCYVCKNSKNSKGGN